MYRYVWCFSPAGFIPTPKNRPWIQPPEPQPNPGQIQGSRSIFIVGMSFVKSCSRCNSACMAPNGITAAMAPGGVSDLMWLMQLPAPSKVRCSMGDLSGECFVPSGTSAACYPELSTLLLTALFCR